MKEWANRGIPALESLPTIGGSANATSTCILQPASCAYFRQQKAVGSLLVLGLLSNLPLLCLKASR